MTEIRDTLRDAERLDAVTMLDRLNSTLSRVEDLKRHVEAAIAETAGMLDGTTKTHDEIAAPYGGIAAELVRQLAAETSAMTIGGIVRAAAEADAHRGMRIATERANQTEARP